MPSLVYKGSRKLCASLGMKEYWNSRMARYVWETHPLSALDKGGKQILQIVGIPRSGTTLLTAMLNMHEEISCLSEPYRNWFLRGTVEGEGARGGLAKLWDGHPRRAIAEMLQQPSVRIVGIKETFCTREHGCMANEHYFRRNIADGSADKTVVILRDPRDCWVSLLKRMPEVRDEKEIATDRFMASWNQLGKWVLEQNIVHTRYEDLVNEPERELRRITEYLGIAFRPEMLTPGRVRGTGDRSAIQGERSVTNRSVSRHSTELRSESRERIERACGEMMARMGYGV